MENDIKRGFYSSPVQVKFGQRSDDDGVIYDNYGIAFQDHIICLCCGYPLALNDEDLFVWEELDWHDIENQFYS